MREFVSSGNIALLALAVLALETVLLAALRDRLPAALPTIDIVLMALPGAALLLAMYCALIDSAWQWIAVSLTLALVAHVADLARRCRPALSGRY